MPRDVFNAVIYLKVKPNGCYDGERHEACYRVQRGKPGLPEMIFDDPKYIYQSLVEHEFGHALGRLHEDLPKGIHSIMLPVVTYDDYVLPADIDFLCELHEECPPHENTWCEGGFYDEYLCPSSSYEEGRAKYEAEVEDEE